MGGVWDNLGPLLGTLGRFWVVLGGFEIELLSSIGPRWAPRGLLDRFGVPLGGVWEGFGEDLGGSWEDFSQFWDGFWRDLGKNEFYGAHSLLVAKEFQKGWGRVSK